MAILRKCCTTAAVEHVNTIESAILKLHIFWCEREVAVWGLGVGDWVGCDLKTV